MPDERHPVVAVTGSDGTIGRRVVADLQRVAARVEAVDVAMPDLKRALADVDTVVHLAFEVTGVEDDAAIATRNAEDTRRLLDAASSAGIDHVVLLSSAAVYGAWPNNPVPLTEDAPVRPNPGFGFAVQKAELERLAGEWADEHPGSALTVLRPAVPMDRNGPGFLSAVLGVRATVATGDPEVPVQFVHLDDLSAAVAHSVAARLDGVFNVAADGWITAGEARALAGTPPRLPVPDRIRAVLVRFGHRPSAAEPYTRHSWVVASDRLKATGWSPQHTNEVTVVDTTEGSPWTRLSPKRKQELALGGAVVGMAAAAATVLAVVRWLRHRRAG